MRSGSKIVLAGPLMLRFANTITYPYFRQQAWRKFGRHRLPNLWVGQVELTVEPQRAGRHAFDSGLRQPFRKRPKQSLSILRPAVTVSSPPILSWAVTVFGGLPSKQDRTPACASHSAARIQPSRRRSSEGPTPTAPQPSGPIPLLFLLSKVAMRVLTHAFNSFENLGKD